MLKILICFSLVFGPSMQAFGQGAAQPKKENARFPDPRDKEKKEAKLQAELSRAKDLALRARMDYAGLKLTEDQTAEYQKLIADAKAKLDSETAALVAISESLKRIDDPVSCFDLFALGGRPHHGLSITMPTIYGGALAVLLAAPELGGTSNGVALGAGALLAVGGFIFSKHEEGANRAYNLATRFDLPSYGVDTTLTKEELSDVAKYKESILNGINRKLSRRGKVSAKASIDDVRAVMVEGFNSGDFCRAKAPASDEVSLMKPKAMNAYILSKLESRLGGSTSSATGGSSGSGTNSVDRVKIPE